MVERILNRKIKIESVCGVYICMYDKRVGNVKSHEKKARSIKKTAMCATVVSTRVYVVGLLEQIGKYLVIEECRVRRGRKRNKQYA